MQCVGLEFRRSRVRVPLAAFLPAFAPCKCISGVTVSQLDLPSLMPLSVASCGRLQPEQPIGLRRYRYCKLLIIYPTFSGSSSIRVSSIKV